MNSPDAASSSSATPDSSPTAAPAPRLTLPKRKAAIVRDALAEMARQQLIAPEVARDISGKIAPLNFDWRRLARYAFAGALVCIVIAVGAALADKWLMDLIAQLFHASWGLKSLACAAVSALLFWFGTLRRQRAPEKIYSNEAIYFGGVLGIAAAVACLGKAIDNGSGHFSLLILLAALIYSGLGLLLESKLIWVFGLLSLGSWFGAETGYASGWGAYYLGMAYPLRFVLFGAALTLLSLLLRGRPRFAEFFGTTRVVGLLYLFIALWILSIWGNYDGYASWHRATHFELFHWSLYFGAVAAGCIYLGLKNDDGVLRGFGLTFLGLNLYTRFFEFFWDDLHKAVFFAILGASLWLLGSRAETIWQMRRLKHHLAADNDDE